MWTLHPSVSTHSIIKPGGVLFVPLFTKFLKAMHRDALSSSPSAITRFFGCKPMATLGSLAFPMFIVHGPIGQMFYKKVTNILEKMVKWWTSLKMTWEISTNWACTIGINAFNASQKIQNDMEQYAKPIEAVSSTSSTSHFHSSHRSRTLCFRWLPGSFGENQCHTAFSLSTWPFAWVLAIWWTMLGMKGCLDGVRLTITTIYLIIIFVKRLRPLVCAVLFGEYQVEKEKNTT